MWAGNHRQHRYGDNADFFADLGALREKLYIFAAAITEIEPRARALRMDQEDES